MYKVKNPNRLDIFDPWAYLTPKRRQMLDSGWPGLFREHILPSIPVNKVFKHFDGAFGRPTKELYAMLGALILQQTLHLTDEQTVHQYAFDTVKKNIVDKYFSQKALGCFSRVKPSESRKTLTEVSKDLFNLVQQFKHCSEVTEMYCYKLLQRVLHEMPMRFCRQSNQQMKKK